MKKVVVTTLLCLIQLACQKNSTVDFSEWRKGGGTTPPPLPQFEKQSTTEIATQGKLIIIDQQKILGVPVEDGFTKSIHDNSQELTFQAFNIVSTPLLRLKSDLVIMKASRPSFYKTATTAYPELTKYKSIKSEILIKQAFPFWRFTFEDKQGILFAVDVSRQHIVSQITKLGSNLNDAQAILFPQGPLKSHLQDVVLERLLDPSTLISEYIKVTTRSPLTAQAIDKKFNFATDDTRFFQLQAFYYSSQLFDWFKEKFSLNMPSQLSIETAIGYPEKTNTAFYFSNSIRLGDGDDVVFSKIPLDPSIVMHESSHAIIDYVARLPFEGEGGSINEGFADFFTTSLLKNPLLGEVAYKKAPFKRTVQNPLKLTETNGGLYHDSGIISGLFWQIRQEIDETTALNLAWNALLRCHPKTDFKIFKENLVALVSEVPADKQLKINSILKDRGWLD